MADAGADTDGPMSVHGQAAQVAIPPSQGPANLIDVDGMNDRELTPAVHSRHLLRSLDRAALSTLLADGGHPYGSLVLVACDYDATPLLLLSDLAVHSRNIAAEARVSLLYDDTAGLESPLTGARATVLGRAVKSEEPRHRQRFLARHPEAAQYAGFGDFHVYAVPVERAHLVAGFGRIDWIDGAEVIQDGAAAMASAAWETAVVEHMNDDHADAIQLYAQVLLGADGAGWSMTGCDSEGCDLRRGGRVLRLPFASTVLGADDARRELVRLVRKARGDGGHSSA